MSEAPGSEGSSLESLVAQLADEFRERLERGERPSVAEYVARHPQHAAVIRNLFASVQFIRLSGIGASGRPAGDAAGLAAEDLLGDFRVLRVVGRGGMGVVYEAVQESLDRPVALKVPHHALNPTQLERFQNEARAAARLHHTNIVPVFGVGEDHGVPYYAMQFIDGRGLDEVLGELRGLRGAKAAGRSGRGFPAAAEAARSLLTGHFAAPPPAGGSTAPEGGPAPPPAGAGSTAVLAPGRPEAPTAADDGRPYWQEVARLGVQVAEALAYAHGQGILHRDIKPSNLLLDRHGTVWVTDFGLAKAADGGDLTAPGDVVGTVRYMAPERFQGKADARSDVYSLGLTLYELLTLRPAFADEDRNKLLAQVQQQEPPRPRTLNAAIPRDLETVVLKATAKEPERRYQTAADLADDLRRFAEDRPIRARRVGVVERLWRWCRRNPALAAAAGSISGLLVAIAVITSLAALWLNDSRLATLRQLYEAKRAEARAARGSGRSGQRLDALDALAQAARLVPELGLGPDVVLGLRNEAIACLALNDFRLDQEWEIPEDDLNYAVAIDPRLQRYAWSDREGNIVVCRVRDHQEIARLKGLGAGKHAFNLFFSPTGEYLAALHVQNSGPRVWDLSKPDEPRINWSPPTRALDYTPDGGRVLLADQDGSICFLKLADGQEEKKLPPPDFVKILALTVDATGKRVAVNGILGGPAGGGAGLAVLDAETGEIVFHVSIPPGSGALALSPGGGRLAAALGAVDGTGPVVIWDVLTGRRLAECKGDHGWVLSLAFTRDGDLLVSTDTDNIVHFWDVGTGRQLLSGPGGPPLWFPGGPPLRFGPDYQRLALARNGSKLGIWGVSLSRELSVLRSEQATGRKSHTLSVSPDGRLLASAHEDGVRLWDLAFNKEVMFLPLGMSTFVDFFKKGDLVNLITVGREGVFLWPIRPDPEQIGELRFGPAQSLGLLEDRAAEQSAWLSANRKTLALADRDLGEVRVIDLEQGTQNCLIRGPRNLHSVMVSPDGRWVVTIPFDVDQRISVWDASTGKQEQDLDGVAWVNPTAFSPDGQWLVTGIAGEVRFWETGSWAPDRVVRRTPRRSTFRRVGMTFSPDGRVLALAIDLHGVQLLDAATGQELALLQSPPLIFTGCPCFSPDGSRLAVALDGQGIQVWDLRLIREQLTKIGLDWDPLSYPPLCRTDPAAPLRIQGIGVPIRLEAEALQVLQSTDCASSVQDMARWGKDKWSGGQQLFCDAQKGGSVVLELELPQKGTYRLEASLTKAPDFGVVEVSLDGKRVGKPFDGFHPTVAPPTRVDLGWVELAEGKHRVRFEAVDKNSDSTNYFMGIDCLSFTADPSR